LHRGKRDYFFDGLTVLHVLKIFSSLNSLLTSYWYKDD